MTSFIPWSVIRRASIRRQIDSRRAYWAPWPWLRTRAFRFGRAIERVVAPDSQTFEDTEAPQ